MQFNAKLSGSLFNAVKIGIELLIICFDDERIGDLSKKLNNTYKSTN